MAPLPRIYTRLVALRLALSLLLAGIPALAIAQSPGSDAVSAQHPAGTAPDAGDAMLQSLKSNLSKLDSTLYNPPPAQSLPPLENNPGENAGGPAPVDVMPPPTDTAAPGATAGTEAALDTEETLKTGNLETRIYKNYLGKAETISTSLIEIRNRLQKDASDDTPATTSSMTGGVGSGRLSLQQLGALTQNLSAENQRFEDSFQYGENHFSSYEAIETAVKNLEDAVYYWRSANRFRSLYRKTAIEHVQDDEVLQVKILKAMEAIDRLNNIMKIRGALDRLEAEYKP